MLYNNSKIITIILSFRVSRSKNKNIDHGVKAWATMSPQITYEIDHVSLLQDSTILSALDFFFFFYVFYCNLKEKGQITRNINSKKRNV